MYWLHILLTITFSGKYKQTHSKSLFFSNRKRFLPNFVHRYQKISLLNNINKSGTAK